jgi:putative endonuclease
VKQHNYYVYITTNSTRSTVYVGVTNDMRVRLQQHFENKGRASTFAGRYHCYHLVFWERHQFVEHAIAREKEIKRWRRAKKDRLIESFNPEWRFLESDVEALMKR